MEPRAVIDSLDVGVAAIAPDWTIVEWSAPATRITGLRADQVLGRNFWTAFPGARGSNVERTLHEVLLDGEPRTYLTPAPVPELASRVLETRVTRGPRNHLVLLLRHLRDEPSVDSRTGQLLAATEVERRLYAQLFSAVPIPALIVTADAQILDANPAGGELLGVADTRALRGRSLADWAPQTQRAALAVVLRDAVTKAQRARLAIEVGGESPREVEAVIENLEGRDGAAKLLLLAVDVSREVLLQRKLLQSDRLSQLGALVSGVAHELNNPLAAIAAFAEVLKVDAATADQRESADVIHLEAMRAGRVVQTLLDFARQRPRVRQPVDLKDVADRVIALHKSALRKARVQAVVVIDDSTPAVIGDPQELQQVLLNAVVNAEQAIAAQGRPGKVFITARRMEDHVVLLVEDTGPGIPPEILDRVFEPFFTTKGDAGTGLGLAISYGLVKASGGRMYIHNLEGGGVRLGIELPIDPAQAAPATAGGFKRAERPLSVLVVDDEESVRRGLIRMAERLGHRVASAPTFAEAILQLKAGDARFDALLLDVHLDEANTGFDLFDTLRQEGRGRERHVIFTTGDSMSTKTRDLLQQAERPLLKKPFNLEELREVLDRVAGE